MIISGKNLDLHLDERDNISLYLCLPWVQPGITWEKPTVQVRQAVLIKFPYNRFMSSNEFKSGDRVKIFLDSKYWRSEGWFEGTIIRIDPYSEHRSFYWVELEHEVDPMLGKATKFISVFNPKYIMKH